MNEYKLKTESEWNKYDPNLESDKFMLETLKSIYGDDAVEIRINEAVRSTVNVGPIIASPRHVVNLSNNVDAETYRIEKSKQQAATKNNTRPPQKQSSGPPPGTTLSEIQDYYYQLARQGLLK